MGTLPLNEIGTIPICLIHIIQPTVGSNGLGFEIVYSRYGHSDFPSSYLGSSTCEQDRKRKTVLFRCESSSIRQAWIREITILVDTLRSARRGLITALGPGKTIICMPYYNRNYFPTNMI